MKNLDERSVPAPNVVKKGVYPVKNEIKTSPKMTHYKYNVSILTHW